MSPGTWISAGLGLLLAAWLAAAVRVSPPATPTGPAHAEVTQTG